MTTDASSSWYSDDPTAERADDTLDRGEFLSQLESVLDSVSGSGKSSVLGLIGAWGSGKSSILEQIGTRLTDESSGATRWIQVKFNPWFYQDLASLQNGFFSELQSSLPSGKSWRKAREAIAGLGKSVAPFGGAFGLLGFNPSDAIAAAAELIEPDQTVSAQRIAAQAALEMVSQPVLVVVDDVDRLDPEELLLLFKLIRLVGRLPNVYYILAYDEKTLLEVLGRTGLVGGSEPRRAIDYLEKIVQVRLDVPPIRSEQLTAWVDQSLENIAERHDLELTEDFSRRFGRAYVDHLQERLATPRGVKHYFAQVDSFLAGLVNEVDLVDFLLVSWIRSAEPLVYRALITNRRLLLGRMSRDDLSGLFGDKNEVGPDFWLTVLQRAHVAPENIEGVAKVIGLLFPRFEHHWSARKYAGSSSSKDPRRISNPDYFDRYFAFAVPTEDLSDQQVSLAYHQILTGDNGDERKVIEAHLPDRGVLILTKFEALSSSDAGQVELVKWLIEQYPRLPQHQSIADATQHAKWLGSRLYVQLPSVEQLSVLELAKGSLDRLQFFSFLSGSNAKDRQEAEAPDEPALTDVDRSFAETISDEFQSFDAKNPLEIPSRLWGLMWEWLRTDPDGVKNWFKEEIQAKEWPLLDVAARFVGVQFSLGVKNPVRRVGDFDLESFQKVVDIDRVIAETDLASQDANLFIAHDLEATADNRRLFARVALARHIFTES